MPGEQEMPGERGTPEEQGLLEPVDDSESDVFEIDLPITVFVLSDDDFLQDDTEEQPPSVPEAKQDGAQELNASGDGTPLNGSNGLSTWVVTKAASNKDNGMECSEETCAGESVCNSTKTSLRDSCDAGTGKYSEDYDSPTFWKTELTEVNEAGDREDWGGDGGVQKIPPLSALHEGGDETVKTSRQLTLAAMHRHEKELVSVASAPSDGNQEKQPEIHEEMETNVEMEDPDSSKNGDQEVKKRSKFEDESLSSLLEHGLKEESEESECTYCSAPLLSGCSSEELLKNVGKTEVNASTSAEPKIPGEHIYKTLTPFPRKRYWQRKADASATEHQSQQGLAWLGNGLTIKPLSKAASSMNKLERLKCSFCSLMYKSSAHLKKHIYSAHKNKKTHKCRFCKRTFFFSVNLKNHLKFHKKISKLRKARKNRINARKLMEGRAEERKYEAKKKESKYDKFFIKMERDFTPLGVPVSFSCKNCFFASSSPRTFIHHMKGHKERPPYQCPQCDYSCLSLSYLLNHMYWHAGYKLYQCRFCTFFSLYFASMVRHSYTHTGAKPYSCEFCESAFTSTTGLKRHMRLHASEETSQGQQVDFINGRKAAQKPLKHYTCTECNIVFYSRGHFGFHKKFHDQCKGTANGYVSQSNECENEICGVDSSLQDHAPLSLCGKENGCLTGEVLASELDLGKAGEVWDNKTCSEKKFPANSHKSKTLPLTGNRSEGPLNSYKMDTFPCRKEPLFNSRDLHSQVQDDNAYQRCMENLSDTQPSNLSGFKTYKCQHCNYATVIHSNFKLHLKMHTNERPFVCKECNEAFKTSKLLEKHSLVHVRSECEFYHCLYVDSHLENLELHPEMHGGMYSEGDFDSFEGSSSVHSLLDSGVSGAQPDVQRVKETDLLVGQPRFYQCAECEYTTYTLSNLELHIRTHTGEKPYSCSVCQKKFRTSSHLRRHRVTHSNIEHLKCRNCDYSTNKWLSLKRHLASHSCGESSSAVSFYQPQNQLPFKIYVCEECGYSTAHNGNLKLHLRIHTGEKPFKCGQCALAFRTSSHLKRHVLTHLKLHCRRCKFSTLDNQAFQMHAKTHIKKYKCGKCNVTLSTKKLLEKHKQQHELEV